MPAATVFVCPPESVTTVATLADDMPACATGQGEWKTVLLAEPFDPASLNSPELAGAFGAGFTVLGTGLAIAWAARMLVAAVRSSV